MASILTGLQNRDALHDVSHYDDLDTLLSSERISFYCGFDPTADSLHAGSMLPLILMRRLQEQGHTPIVVIGTATGMIGDPSGKSEERILLSQEELDKNTNGISAQLGKFLSNDGPNAFTVLQNHCWLKELDFVSFLRDIGKHVSVNSMISKESVKTRLENREQGISFTEFSYMLLQAYDYVHLNSHHKCRLQVGGSDQWGNITAGLELIRKLNPADHKAAYGLTFPLLTTASGSKFGKTEKGTIWLDETKTSAYEFFQYWLNTSDQDVLRYLKLFSKLEEEQLQEFSEQISSQPEKRTAQKKLAEELTTLVHGQEGLRLAEQASRVLFGEAFEDLDSSVLTDIFRNVPSASVARERMKDGIQLTELLVETGVSKSKGAARRLIEGGGLYLNNTRNTESNQEITLSHFVDEQVLVVRSGKKSYHLIRIE